MPTPPRRPSWWRVPLPVYAVTHKTTTDGNYYVADVVVFEDCRLRRPRHLLRLRVQQLGVAELDQVEFVWGIGYNDEGAIEDQRLDVEADDWRVWNNGRIEFYEIYDDESVVYIADGLWPPTTSTPAASALTGIWRMWTTSR